jgi:glycosyltransferase involved in cell wall biosynthesis
MSSTGEGFPNAVLEYMAAGRPVVATDVGGVAEAVEDGQTGPLVPQGNDVALANGIIALLRDPERARRMGARRRRCWSDSALGGSSSRQCRSMTRSCRVQRVAGRQRTIDAEPLRANRRPRIT